MTNIIRNKHTPFTTNTLRMTEYEHEIALDTAYDTAHDTVHDATKRYLIDCIAELTETKTELPSPKHE